MAKGYAGSWAWFGGANWAGEAGRAGRSVGTTDRSGKYQAADDRICIPQGAGTNTHCTRPYFGPDHVPPGLRI